MSVNHKLTAEAAHAIADANVAQNASATDPVVVADAPANNGPKPEFNQAEFDRKVHFAALAAAPIFNVGLALYVNAGRPTIEAAIYRQQTGPDASPKSFDATMQAISDQCLIMYFEGVYRPDNAIRAVIFHDECVRLGIPSETVLRVPFRRMLTIFAACFNLDKKSVTGAVKDQSAEWVRANVGGNAIPESKPGEKKAKAIVKPDVLRAALDAHVAEAAKVDPKSYPDKPSAGNAGSGRAADPKPKGAAKPKDWTKFKAASATDLVNHLAAAGNTKALAALAKALKALKAQASGAGEKAA